MPDNGPGNRHCKQHKFSYATSPLLFRTRTTLNSWIGRSHSFRILLFFPPLLFLFLLVARGTNNKVISSRKQTEIFEKAYFELLVSPLLDESRAVCVPLVPFIRTLSYFCCDLLLRDVRFLKETIKIVVFD